MTAIAINGATGRMGRTLTTLVVEDAQFQLRCALTHGNSAKLGQDIGLLAGTNELGVAITTLSHESLKEVKVVIDFSVPQATIALLDYCTTNHLGLVTGTTGFNKEQQSLIESAANEIPVLVAPNMSIGVNVAFRLIEHATKMLDSDVDVEIFETHHRNKLDAPSGTAVRMGELVASARGKKFAELATFGRKGVVGSRDAVQIGIHAARGGDVVGEHTATFYGKGERLEIIHRASSRTNFAAGALRAAVFLAAKLDQGAVGMYSMNEILGFA